MYLIQFVLALCFQIHISYAAEILSLDDINTIASRAWNNKTIAVIKYGFIPHSNKHVGFFGSHKDLTIIVQRDESENKEIRQFFVKGLPEKNGNQLQFIQDRNLFNQEKLYYNELLPLLREDFIGDDWSSKCFLANNEILVLEDLRSRKYFALNSLILDGMHLKAVAKTQARLHAASILAEARLGKPLKDILPDSCVEQVFRDEIRATIDVMADLMQKIAQKLGYSNLKFKNLLLKGFTKMHDQSSYKSKLNRVMCHGDTWPNNYLFGKSESGEIKAVMVDFQFTRYVSQAYDLVQFIHLSTTVGVRMKEEKSVIKAYHEELSTTLKMNNPDVPIPSLSDFLEEYEDLRLSALFAAGLYYPTIYVDPKVLIRYNADQLYEKIFARTNNDFLMELYDKDDFYASQLNGLVLDLIKYQRLGRKKL